MKEDDEYTEYEIRTLPYADHRAYMTARFPPHLQMPDIKINNFEMKYIPKPDPNKSDLEENAPDTLMNNNYMNDDNPFERKGGFKGFKRRRWRHDTEYMYELTVKGSSDDKQTFHGIQEKSSISLNSNAFSRKRDKDSNGNILLEGEQAPYVMLVPPEDKSGCFRAVNISLMYNFQPELKYKPLTLDETEEILASKTKVAREKAKKATGLMRRLMEKQKKMLDAENRQRRAEASAANDDFERDYDNFEDDDNVQDTRRKGKSGAELEDNDGELDLEANERNKEEDIEELAIDKVEENDQSLADFNEDFQDDEDETAEIKEINKIDDEEREARDADDFRIVQDELEEEGKEMENLENLGEELNPDVEIDDEDLDTERLNVMFSKEDNVGNESDEDETMALEQLRESAGVAESEETNSPENFTPFASNIPEEEKTERQKFAESLIAKRNNKSLQPKTSPMVASSLTKRKIDTAESNLSKKSKTSDESGSASSDGSADLAQKLTELLKNNGGKMQTKQLVKAAKKAGLVSNNEVFKSVLNQLCEMKDDPVEGKVFMLRA